MCHLEICQTKSGPLKLMLPALIYEKLQFTTHYIEGHFPVAHTCVFHALGAFFALQAKLPGWIQVSLAGYEALVNEF